MGCPNDWGTSGELGSDIPCVATGRIVKDGNNEDQKNGTYYHYQAASVGTGSAITTNNANVPDTFCPLGWQLPYSGTAGEYYNQSRSWKYLLDSYGITYDNGNVTEATKIKSYPFSYVLSGNFHWAVSRLFYQSIGEAHTHFWSSTIGAGSNAKYRFHIGSMWIQTQSTSGAAGGYNLRCVTRN